MPNSSSHPFYQSQAKASLPRDYPKDLQPDVFFDGEVVSTYEQRQKYLISFRLHNLPDTKTRSIFNELIRMIGGVQSHEGWIYSALNFIHERKDCADFVVHSIIRLLIQFNPENHIITPYANKFSVKYPPSRDLLKAAKENLLNFKYWPDEPGDDSMCYWTENHYILYASAAFIVGQIYPEDVFLNSGETGQEKMIKNRPRILRWLDMRFKTGFSEWLSNVYYEEDLTALLTLHDFCDDVEIREKTTKIIDLLLLDMVLNQFYGLFGCTHGRTYERHKKWMIQESSITTMKLLFGRGIYTPKESMGSSSLLFSKYQVPPVLHEIFQVNSKTFINQQRAGFLVQDQDYWHWDYTSLEDGMIFLGNEAYLHPATVKLTIKLFDVFRWWNNSFFARLKPFKVFLKILQRLHLLKPLAHLLNKDLCRNMRDEVNIYTYKTSDYMLSTAQDYRKGYGGDQHHIWQATLGPNAVCFTTHPGRIGSSSPNYWEGSGVLPRSIQFKNLNITIYKIRRLLPAYVPIRNFYTHAWFPKDEFDEVIEENGWIFARKKKGYLALYSQHPYFWNTEDLSLEKHHIRKKPEDFNREVIVPGKTNIWICQLGNEAEYGSFHQFIKNIKEVQLEFKGLSVEFDSPGNGLVSFGWKSPLLVDGREIQIDKYPRYDNPYVQAEFKPNEIHIRANKKELYLNWKTEDRRT